MCSSSSRRDRLAEHLNYLKADYRPRFGWGRGNEINVQPGQDVKKFIEDCFKNADSDITIGSPSPNLCLLCVVQDEKTTSTPSTSPNAGLNNSVKRPCNSAESLPTVNSRDSEDDQTPVGSPIPLEEVEISPVHMLQLDEQSTAAVKGYSEGENLEDLHTARDEQVDLLQGTERIAMSSVQKEKSFALVASTALAPGTLGERSSTSVSQPSRPPVKDQAIEVESECEFLILSDDASLTSSFSIPQKSRMSKKGVSATPVMKSQPSEKTTTESKNSKKKKVQIGAGRKQKMPDLDVQIHDSKEAPQSDPVSSNSERQASKSQRQNSAHVGKAKKNSLRQGSPNQKKFWKPESKELVLSQSGLETETSGSDRCKPRVMPSEDLPGPSAGHQQEWTLSLKTYVKSSKCQQLASKASQCLAHKKQNAHQKLSKDKVAERLAESLREKHKKSGKKSSKKKPHLQRGESSDSEAGEEWLEIQPVQLTEVFTSPLLQKLQTSVVQMLDKSGKPKNAWDNWESLGDADNATPVKALDIDSVQNSEKKQSAKSGKIPKKIPHRTSKDVRSGPEDASDTQNTMDSGSSSVQHVARKNQKPSTVKIKSNKRKRNMQHGLQDSFADEKAVGYESRPVLEPGDKFTSRSRSSEQDNTPSENSEDWNCQLKNLLSDSIRHKIVMPSNSPNVRRTKRIRMRPLEYWRGEHVSYTMRPSGELVISGIVCPVTEPPRKIKRRKCCLKQKRDETNPEDDQAPVGSPIPLEEVESSPVHMSSTSVSQPSRPPVKDQAIEVESECEFLILSDDASLTSSFSIPRKSTMSKKGVSATRVMKSQPSEKTTTESKNSKNKKVQVGAGRKQKMPDLDVQIHDSKEAPQSDPVSSNSERKASKSQRQNRAHVGGEVSANWDHTLADTSKPTVVLDPLTNKEVLLECVYTAKSHSCFFEDETVEIYKNLNTSAFATGTLILKPFKEKGRQYVHMDTIAFHVIHGRIIVTLHKSSYYLTAGDDFCVPAGNEYNIRNLLNEESVLFFTQLKDR